MEKDWAKRIIDELKEKHISDNDQATRLFCEAYANGDAKEAWDTYRKSSVRQETFQPNNYDLILFGDGSCYAEWKTGIDRFFPSLSDLTDEDGEQDVSERFSDE